MLLNPGLRAAVHTVMSQSDVVPGAFFAACFAGNASEGPGSDSRPWLDVGRATTAQIRGVYAPYPSRPTVMSIEMFYRSGGAILSAPSYA